MTLIIAGERSGVGKTTVTLALLSFLCRWQKLSVQSFKVGPDYIDPMFHLYVTGSPCRNLDPVLTSETYVQQCFIHHTQQSEYALVEGVMGLFDGIGSGEVKSQKSKVKSQNYQLPTTNYQPPTTNYQLPINFASTAHIARILDLPVVLVIDCSRLSGSVAAIAHGYRSFDPRVKIVGFVLNRVGSDRHLQLLQDALAPLDLPILGVLRRHDNITIPDRHLGLVPTAELPQLDLVIEQLATLAQTCFDWDKLMPLLKAGVGSRESGVGGKRAEGTGGAEGAEGAERAKNNRQPSTVNCQLPTTNYQLPNHQFRIPNSEFRIRLAVARDRAFNFYYQDNLDLLQQLGAELVFWSPLTDSELPENIHGLYFGGGFPEVFAQQLAANTGAIASVKTAILAGMPTYAECGGLMYLCDKIIDFEQNSWSMVGVIPTASVMGSRLTLGYRHCIALQDSPILQTGDTVWGHEFHRSSLSELPTPPLFQTQGLSTPPVSEGWRLPHLHASYVHLHFGTRPDIPARFLQHCGSWRASRGLS
ncbi:cobyrinate a,c-diamide synthase [Scytonema millei]|uniref:Cobyrinate a,c-diamide synthase n=1 Tax=Scytonema millei VB511283 TaxID=1245923 RepID=A0A9X5I2X7_9CYAN|nr:cobyrinate a,c-diamide synthase [Scytonema millei]NHC33898.1 cobyrinate a,c-diamide synthase [Scytonema millei VB511283]